MRPAEFLQECICHSRCDVAPVRDSTPRVPSPSPWLSEERRPHYRRCGKLAASDSRFAQLFKKPEYGPDRSGGTAKWAKSTILLIGSTINSIVGVVAGRRRAECRERISR